MSTLTILVDTREQANDHITAYLDKKKVAYESVKLDVGDYSAKIPANPELGIVRDLYLPAAIERKNSVDELAQTIKTESRWEHELVRSKELDFFTVVVEGSYVDLVNGNYRSQYNSKALQARIKSYEARFRFTTVFVPKELSAHYIHTELYYRARHELRNLG
ncbi:ERCC4 domain-containing protein [Paenibacillus alkalitolerans]|uniref:ERCC4 domain-containing protein n=1 Tax=Paenibacillus alkalitolerans TaxID=2799335 RepID=UPI001F1714B7|nr:ERCC4 domain-containing protein [Paenibacillus alkalitolerans]